MSEQLKPCPCCKAQSIYSQGGDWWSAECLGCGLTTSAFNSPEEAVAAWNRRAAPEIDVEAVARVVYEFECWKPERSEVREAVAEGIARAAVAEVLRQIGGSK